VTSVIIRIFLTGSEIHAPCSLFGVTGFWSGFSPSCAQASFCLSFATGHDFLSLASVPWYALVSSLIFSAFVSSILS
jgi:hypothetical protein